MKRILIFTASLALSGCSTVGRVCDEASLGAEYEHVSHPFAGYPFGEKVEEDALHTVGTIGRCSMGRAYVEGGVGYKVRDGGFYGPDLTGTLRVGVTLWESK
jgi:hypothetical protein